MKVLLISTNKLRIPYPVYPLGVDHVAGAISPKHQVKILDLCLTGTNQPIQEAINAFAPDVVGLSMRNVDNVDISDSQSFIADFSDIAQQVRATGPATLVLGGCVFSLFPGEMMRLLDADFGVVGEGERLLDLLEALEAGGHPEDIPGVLSRQSQSAPPPQPWEGAIARGMETLPFCAPFYIDHGGMLNLQTKRGCPFHCVYCTYVMIEGHSLRRFAPAEVGATARRLQDAGAKFLFFTDSVFNCDTLHNLQVAEALEDAGVSIPWGAFFAPLPLPDGYFERLAESGLTHVEFGTEALCAHTLRTYRKPFRVDDVFSAHQAAVEAGLYVAHYFLLGGPGEDRETLDQTLKNADKLRRAALFFFCGMRIFPLTVLLDLAIEEGQINPDQDLLEPVFYRSEALGDLDVLAHVEHFSQGRVNWIIGAGDELQGRFLARLHSKGVVGPLWEKCII